MFQDDNSEEYEEQPESNSEIRQQQEHIEKEFFAAIEDNQDVSIYLYLPFQLLSKRVRDELDKYLMEQAYVNMFIRKDTKDVYHDGFVQIGVEDDAYRIELLEKMLPYFTTKEEYEKCANIRDRIEQLKNNSK
jgi:hypothetical protein